MKKRRLKTKIGNVVLKNPVIAASGTFGYGQEVCDSVDVDKFGGFVTKTVTIKPRKGNVPPRIYDLGFGVINSVGMENPGVRGFKREKMPFLSSLKTRVFVSIYSEKKPGWKRLVKELDKEDIAGFELNLSCPNIEGSVISADPKQTKAIISSVRDITSKPLIAKLSFSPQIKKVSLSAQAAGIDSLTLINTIPAMVLNVQKQPVLGNEVGGLSGPCIKPVALRCVYEVCSLVSIPVIACGGIMNYGDILDFFAVGATAVELGTVNIVDPFSFLNIIKDLEKDYG